jgi:hypothetical protein
MITQIGDITHDSKINDNIQLVLSELIECNKDNIETPETIHIFIDINNYFNSIENFTSNIHKYLSKSVKIYFLRETLIIDYTNVIFVSKHNIDAIKFVVNIQKKIEPLLISKQQFQNYLNEKKIIIYEFYCWKQFDFFD